MLNLLNNLDISYGTASITIVVLGIIARIVYVYFTNIKSLKEKALKVVKDLEETHGSGEGEIKYEKAVKSIHAYIDIYFPNYIKMIVTDKLISSIIETAVTTMKKALEDDLMK